MKQILIFMILIFSTHLFSQDSDGYYLYDDTDYSVEWVVDSVSDTIIDEFDDPFHESSVSIEAVEFEEINFNNMIGVYVDYHIQKFTEGNVCLPYDYDELYNAYQALKIIQIKSKTKYFDVIELEELEKLFNYSHHDPFSSYIQTKWQGGKLVKYLIIDPPSDAISKDLFSN